MNSILRALLVFVLLAAAGCAPDTPKVTPAVAALHEQAKEGSAIAQSNLGAMYANGDGVPKDYAEAIKWFRMAADLGNANAQNERGLMYGNGTGVPKDLVQAHAWLNIAGANGHEEAKKSLEIAENQMTSEQKAEAMKLARELFAKLPPKR